MKSEIGKWALLIMLLNCSLFALEVESQITPVGWIDSREGNFSDGLLVISTNFGSVSLIVLDFDEEGQRFLVECIKRGADYYPIPDTGSEWFDTK